MLQQKEFLLIYAFLIILLVSWLYRQYERRELTEQVSTVNDITYLVRRQNDSADQLAAANLLGRLAEKAEDLIAKMQTKYGTSDARVNRLAKRFKKRALSESLSSSKQTSYSINKGQSIVMCIRSKRDGSLTDENTVTFVLLHELGHLMSVSVGHNTEFWDNFRFILAHALYWKLYTYQNFEKKPIPYCGISITDTPLSWNKYNALVKENQLEA